MNAEKQCGSCGKPLRADAAPHGLCPECLFKAGFPTEGGVAESAARFIPPSLEEMSRLFPQLEILGFLGKGGMGAVYKARQPALDRMVALKVLHPALVRDPGFAERFNREARALARLNHPNIVAVYDFGQAGGLHYLLMELVDGANLRELERAGKLRPEQALALVPQICEALQFAHTEGIVHRDVKPENLLVDKKGRLKITDFGIAKIVGVTDNQRSLTGAKDVVGTPNYMAPEQLEAPQTVDHRADIFSLGVVFYEMLTGELPLGKFPPPSRKVRLDVRLDEVVLHALEKEPERRYQQASEVKTEVEFIARGPSSAQTAAGPRTPSVPVLGWMDWAARLLGLSGFLFILVFVLAEGIPAFWGQPPRVQAELVATFVMLAGLLVGWKSEGWGAFLIADGWAIFLIVERGLPPVPFTAFLIVASLYAYCFWVRNRQKAGWSLASMLPGRKWLVGTAALLSLIVAGLPACLTGCAGESRKQPMHQAGSALVNAPSASQAPANQQTPAIVSTSPRVGATEVDPAMTEITVTFDCDMQKGFSWTGGGPDFPSAPSGQKAHWLDNRTCVLPVHLEAGHYYRVGINSKSYQSFRSAAGVPAEPSAIYFTTVGASDELKLKLLTPHVIKFEPPNGAEDVSPDIKELRVTFDIAMGGGFSWCGDGPGYPPSPEGKRAHWTEDGKTCVLPVQLASGHAYELGLNCPCCDNFQSAAGVPLEPVSYTFKTSGPASAQAPAEKGQEYVREQTAAARQGDFWAMYNLWEAYQKGGHGVIPDAQEGRQWLVEMTKNAWVATFEPINAFNPADPGQFLQGITRYSHLYSEEHGLGLGSFFRTTRQNGKLIGSFLTDAPERFKAEFAKHPDLKLLSLEKLTPEKFVEYQERPQESL